MHHPDIAKKSDALTKEEIDALKEKLEVAEKEKNKENDQITIKNTLINTLTKELDFDSSKITLINYIEQMKEKSETDEKSIKEKYDEANKLYLNITEEDLNIEEFDYDTLKESVDQKLKKYEENLTKNTTLVESFVQSMKKELSDKTDIKEYSDEIKSSHKEICIKFSEKETNIKDLYFAIEDIYIDIEDFNFDEFKEEYEEAKQKHSKKLIECNTKKENFAKQLEVKQKETDKFQKEYENEFKKLGFETEEAYKSSILDEDEIETVKAEIKRFNDSCIETKTKLTELKDSLKDKKQIDLEKDKEELEKLQEVLTGKKEEQVSASSKYDMNQKILVKLKSGSDDVLKQIELYAILEELYKTASGNLSGKRRIEFEQYVQAAYFDMILIEANKRLVKMTSSRFELVRKENSSKLSDKIGLDLEVIDNYTGKRRDVKSLSGGESFKAALSLSLGVSDVIQSYSGGVVVDTLFIDEGFGSLDVESREQAINTLNMLTDNNKLIGIISHVTELKERIDKKIVIEKTAEGSKISFEV